jgi:hypothetical protein
MGGVWWSLGPTVLPWRGVDTGHGVFPGQGEEGLLTILAFCFGVNFGMGLGFCNMHIHREQTGRENVEPGSVF